MDVTGSFFGKLRELALTVESEVKHLERAMRREDEGKSSPQPWAARLGLGASQLFLGAPCGICVPACHCPPVLLWGCLWWAWRSAWELLSWELFGVRLVSLSL